MGGLLPPPLIVPAFLSARVFVRFRIARRDQRCSPRVETALLVAQSESDAWRTRQVVSLTVRRDRITLGDVRKTSVSRKDKMGKGRRDAV
jgi:hypothetical protein